MIATSTSNATIRCPSCGAEVPANSAYCLFCGKSLALVKPESQGEADGLKQLVEESNYMLAKAGTGAAETAFGVGCSLGLLLSLVLLALAFLLGARDWTTLTVIGLAAMIVSTAISAFLALRARNATVEKTYAREVQPQVESYLRDNQLTLHEFEIQTGELIAAGAPLRRILTASQIHEPGNSED